MSAEHQAGRLFIFSAPSGGGKSSLARALMEKRDDVAVCVSHTTRQPRPGEENGVHYHFVDQATFERMIEEGKFLEYAKVFDNYYGTSIEAVDRVLRAGKHVLLDIDWQGMRNIKVKMPQAVSIFILPPNRAELEQRLRSRGQDSDEIIARRMREAVSEMRHYDEFDCVIVNDDFDAALTDLAHVLDGEAARVRTVDLDLAALLEE